MRSHILVSTLLGLLLSLGPSSKMSAAQDARSADPATLAKDLAAVKAFRALIASHSYQLPDDKVREIVLAYLEQDKTAGPKEMPAPEKLQGALDLDFESLWKGMIDKTTAGLDPKGKLQLADRLRGYLVQHKQLRTQAEGRYDEYLKKEFPKALARAKARIVNDQRAEFAKVLTDVVASGTPSQEAVCKAGDGGVEEVEQEIAGKALEAVSATTRQVMLVESFGSLIKDIKHIVQDGVAQLDEQMRLFETRPMAVSQQGIEKELNANLTALADRQKNHRMAAPLSPSYGVFTRAAQTLPKEAGRWFDQLVADEGTQATQSLAQGNLRPSQRDAERLRELILADPPTHHEREESWKALEVHVAEMVAVGRKWITDPLEVALRQSSSKDDSNYPMDSFRQDVHAALDLDGTRAYEAWLKLVEALEKHYEETLLDEVRSQIATEQATQYSPLLSDGNWLPSEKELAVYQGNLNEAAVAKMVVWRDEPPLHETVLEETWTLWLVNARKGFSVGENAIRGQGRLVDGMKSTMHDRIRAGPDRVQAEWTRFYTVEAASRWRLERSDAAQKYPELFSKTKERIAEIVAKLLAEVARERELQKREMARERELAQQERAAAEKEKDENPAGSMHAPNVQQEREPSAFPAPPVTQPPRPPATPVVREQPESSPTEARKAESEASIKEDGSAQENDQEGAAEKSGNSRESGQQTGGRQGGRGNSGHSSNGYNLDTTKSEAPDSGDGDGRGGLGEVFYRIGFWTLLFLIFVLAGCWYWNVRYLREYIAARWQTEKSPEPLPVDFHTRK